MSSWRPALRVARRTIRRSLGRSLLVAILVGVPVAAATLTDILYRSTEGAEDQVYGQLGSADASVTVSAANSLADWHPESLDINDVEALPDDRDPEAVDLAEQLPPGSRVVRQPEYLGRELRIAADEGFVRAEGLQAPLGDPLIEHRARLDSGSWPDARDEIVVTRALAQKLEEFGVASARPEGTTIDLVDGPTLRISGISVDPRQLSAEYIMAMPESVLAEHAANIEPRRSSSTYDELAFYLVDLPADTDIAQLWPELADNGIALTSRQAYLEHEASGSTVVTMNDLQAIALSTLVVGLGLLEIVLLAGAAFAVGARRQTRDLGLAAVNGATSKQVRRIVLAQGLVLGIVGAVLGIVMGAVLIVAAEPLWERLMGRLVDEWRFGLAEIAVAAGVGVLSGLAAAIIPAVGAARMKPVDALAGRFRATPLATRLPIAGVVLIALGAATAFAGNRVIAGDFARYEETLASAPEGAWVPTPDTSAASALQILGAVLAIAGIIIVVPALVTFLARLSRRLPFAGRYAFRDAARHRHRTAPTVAAIMIVVTGSVGIAFIIGGFEHADQIRHTPRLPDDVMSVRTAGGPEGPDAESAAAAVAAAETDLPDADVVDVLRPHYTVALADPAQEEELLGELFPAVIAVPEGVLDDCGNDECWINSTTTEVATASPELFEVVVGRPMNQNERDAMDSGDAIVFNEALIDPDGTVTIGRDPTLAEDLSWDTSSAPDPIQLKAHVVGLDTTYTALPGALVAAETFDPEQWSMVSTPLLRYGDASDQDVSAAIMAAELQGAWAYIDEGPEQYAGTIALILVAGSGFVTLVGVAIAVSLAAAESRSDYATLAAVGAPPRRRRLLAAAQALVVAGLGTVLGLVLGGYIAFTAWPTTGSPDFVVPWSALALTGLAVPTLAAVVALIFTPSRLPMLRRIE